ncbi:DUF1566 domain-containing protein [Persicirhabdus sediminis]|uniref:DUF1566 domain-containing protein n=1 Tax=Persicirhabdus sediminis TaxID=454144 RepID=A0A8J7MA32_9BACT|nr:DUF1566 domain-containing protein [Persicirhabdus sediminis]MBK1789714.1 DUF1566 domain-containing protein [Persicirhabdus sediminis]
MKKALCLLLMLLACSVSGQVVINDISPSQAEAGTTGLLVTFTLPASTPPSPPVGNLPSSVTIGSLSGTSITHNSLGVITAVFDIPADEVDGAKDVVLTFSGPTFTQAGGFTVGEEVSQEVSWPNGPPSSGYNLFGPLNSTETYLMDNNKNILKTWSSEYKSGHSCYLTEKGTFMRTANTGSTAIFAGGAGGRVEEYDWDGNLIWAYDYDTADHRQHHDIEVLPNGNILMIAWEVKTLEEALAAGRDPALISEGELWPDKIIEVEPTGSYGGNIVWQWCVWDHLVQDYDASKANYGIVADHAHKINLNYTQSGNNAGIADWNHVNSVDYNAELGHIVLSVRNFSEIWVIDHKTTSAEAAGPAGDLLYRWGNPAAYNSGDTSDQQLFVQHDAQWIAKGLLGEGNIIIFNNGQGRIDGDYSSIEEITPALNEDGSYTMGQPLAPSWNYTSSVPSDFYASRISGVQRLANGNTLICEGTESYAFEVTPDGELVWDHSSSGSLFRFSRYAPDFAGFSNTELAVSQQPYAVVGTGQDQFYGNTNTISQPAIGDDFYGQDANYVSNRPVYELSPDRLTVYDYQTKLSWVKSVDQNGDGLIDTNDKVAWADIPNIVAELNAENYGGFDDWRLPSIKEIYSIIDFRGMDPSGYTGTDTSGLTPYLDRNYFDFGYGDQDAGERIIDAQFWSSSEYVSTVMNGTASAFGFNFGDGRIKGYARDNKGSGAANTMYLRLVRGNSSYGINDFADNENQTVSDFATGLMWAKDDSGFGMNWQDALAWVQEKNAENFLGFNDWRLPNAKEQHTILDYTRSPATHGTAAIDPVFNCTSIIVENGENDFPFYWTSTNHITYNGKSSSAVYHSFGTAFGYFGEQWIDVHGAGAQRSDPKYDDGTDYSEGHGPQGDSIRIDNFARLVRTSLASDDSVGDGILDAWRRKYFGGTGTTTNDQSAAAADPDGNGQTNWQEYLAMTDPTDPNSTFRAELSGDGSYYSFTFPSSSERVYTLWRSADLSEGSWQQVDGQVNLAGSDGYHVLTDPSPTDKQGFYRVEVALP